MSDPLFEVPRKFRHYFKERGQKPSASEVLSAPVQTSAGLDPYDQPLTRQEALHLFRRIAFGGSTAQIDAVVGRLAPEAVHQIVQEGLQSPMPDPPSWHQDWPPWGESDDVKRAYFDKQFSWAAELSADWLKQMVENGLRDRMTLFWHDHFATERATYFYAILAHKYLTTLRKFALGNFRDFVVAVGIDPAMLIYLDGRLSTRQNPNE